MSVQFSSMPDTYLMVVITDQGGKTKEENLREKLRTYWLQGGRHTMRVSVSRPDCRVCYLG